MPTISPIASKSGPTITWAPGEKEGMVASYRDALGQYQDLLASTSAKMPGVDNKIVYAQPGIRDAYDKAYSQYTDLLKYKLIPEWEPGPTFYSGNGKGFGGGILGKVANFVLPQLGAVGGAIHGAISGEGALKGALKSGLSTAASIAVPQISNSLGLGNLLSGSSLTGSTATKLPWLTSGASGGGDWLSGIGDSISGFFDDPFGSITSALEDTLDPKNLIKGGIKYGLGSALGKDNTSGYSAVQDAANKAAGYYQPFLQSGTAANAKLADLFGLNGADAQKLAAADFRTSPGYEFAKDQGIRALDASAAKRGMLLSGNQVQDVQKFGTGLADQEFNTYLANLMATSNQGQSAAQGVGQNQIDAATAYALMKAGKANRSNQLLGSLLDYI